MKNLIKKITHYRVEGANSYIYIGKYPIQFKKKCVILNLLNDLEYKNTNLEKEKELLEININNEIYSNNKLKKEIMIAMEKCNTLADTAFALEKEIIYQKESNAELLNEISSKEKKINEFKIAFTKYKERYVEGLWCTGWIKYWKQYFYEHRNELKEKINIIKTGVDEKSKTTIDLHLERNFNILPEQNYADYFLYDFEKLFTAEEIEGMKAGIPGTPEIREKYNIEPDVYLETPVFQFHCGLTLLPEHITARINETDIIDGGAFWGDSALVLQNYTPRSIHAFEPMPENYEQLCNTKEKNHMDMLKTIKLGLGDRITEHNLYYYEMISGASIFNYRAIINERPEVHESKISITTIDEYVNINNLKVGLIKLDVEGSELETIKGAIQTISRDKPILLISVYHLPKDFFEIKPLLESLNLGYQFMYRKLVFHDPLTEVSLIGYVA